MQWEVLSDLDVTSKKPTSAVIVDQLLKNRRIKNAQEFFEPLPPEKLPLNALGIKTTAMRAAVNRLKKAVQNQEKIIIFGDYDADGVCATAIAWQAIFDLGGKVLPYIPDRFSEGYGLTPQAVRKLKEQDPALKLLVTVDNGIVANAAVTQAKKLGVEVIITDHHQPGKKLPAALAVVHTTKIGGAAIAWSLARELGKPQGLDLAGLGTIADILALVGESRSFAKFGLMAINQTRRLGLLALIHQAGLVKGQIGASQVSFALAPRINAAGRLGHALEALRLLCTREPLKAERLARELSQTNHQRQKIVDQVVIQARLQAQKVKEKVLVLAHETYHEGVIGIAASKLVEEHYRPAIVLSKGKEFSKASGRSIPGFDLIAALQEIADLWEEGGGHPMAAGFTIKTKNLPLLKQRLNEVAEPFLTPEVLEPRLKIDLTLDFTVLTSKLAAKLAAFAPFGLGNPTPTFLTRQVSVQAARAIGTGRQHLKLTLKQKGRSFAAIAFGKGEAASQIKAGEKIDVVYSLEENQWNGKKELQLKVKDLQVCPVD